MKLFKSNVVMIAVLISGSLSAKSLRTGGAVPAAQVVPVSELPIEQSAGAPMPPVDISQLPAPINIPTDISQLPVPMNAPGRLERPKMPTTRRGERRPSKTAPVTEAKLSMENYARNQVTALQSNLVDDIFPKKATIERIVNEFKVEYPGPNKEQDTTILYNAIINNPEIKKFLTLGNAVSVYRFIKETISKAWDVQDELIWSR